MVALLIVARVFTGLTKAGGKKAEKCLPVNAFCKNTKRMSPTFGSTFDEESELSSFQHPQRDLPQHLVFRKARAKPDLLPGRSLLGFL